MIEGDFLNPSHKDMKRHAASGFMYSALSQAARFFTQFISVVVMARLLDPADFGLVAKVSPIYAFALMFHDLGLSQATVQRPNLTSEQVNAFFWINVGVGFLVTLCLVAVSPLVGWFYQDPRAISLTIAMALLIAISGLGNQHGALLYRRMAFKEEAFLNIIGSLAALLIAVLWGYFFRTYWALYAGLFAGTALPSAGAWFYGRWRPSKPRLAAETGEMLKYGLHITSANFMGFVVGNIGSVLIGRVFGDRPLGLYDRAARLLSSPLQQLVAPIGGVVMPILYRLDDDEDKYRHTFLRALGTLTLAIMPLVLWVVVAADVAVSTLLGPQWGDATPVFAALSIAALPELICAASGWLIITQGRSQDIARLSLICGPFHIVGLLAGLPHGILGVAIATAIARSALTPFIWWLACRRGPVTARHILTTLMPQLVAGLAAAPLLLVLRSIWGEGRPLLLLIVGACVSYIVVLAAVALFPAGREAIKRDLGFARYMLVRI